MVRRRRYAEMPVTGLFLHRVADDVPNEWTMSTAAFDSMLEWLRAHVDLVSCQEAQRRIQQGNSGRLAVHLSFDDGYADNCLHAIPSLLQKQIPFTYYVTTHNVRTGKPFPHDLRQGRPLPPNSVDEIRAMAEAGVEIGVHTRTHADLGTEWLEHEIAREVGGARQDLAQWTGRQPRYFAFPYGRQQNLNLRVVRYLLEHDYAGFCSAYGGYNLPGRNSFHLRRFRADPLLARVKNWLTLDPRWLLAPPHEGYLPEPPAARPKQAVSTSRGTPELDAP